MSPIRIAESDARKLINGIIKWVIGIGAVIAIVLIGRAVTPVDKTGQMLFLSPRVAQIARYQRQAEKWVLEMSNIDTNMQALLDDSSTDLFAQDRAFQDISSRTTNLASSIDATSTPDSLSGLHDILTQAIVAHQTAVTALGQWVSAPSADTKMAAQDALTNAAALLKSVYNNPWVTIGQATETP